MLKKYNVKKLKFKLWKQGWSKEEIKKYLKSLRDMNKKGYTKP